MSDTGVPSVFAPCSSSSLTIISECLDLLLALSYVYPWSDDVCRDFELLLEHALQPAQVCSVSGRHEIISVHHHDNATFLISERARIGTSGSGTAVAQQGGATFLPVPCCGPYIDTVSSPRIPSFSGPLSSSQSSTNIDTCWARHQHTFLRASSVGCDDVPELPSS